MEVSGLKMHCRKAILLLTAAVLCLFGIGIAASTISPVSTPDVLSKAQSPDGLSGKQSGLPNAQPPDELIRTQDEMSDVQPQDELSGVQSQDKLPATQSQDAIPPAAGSAGNGNAEPEPVQSADKRTRLLRCLHYNEKDFIRSVNETSTGSDTRVFEKDAGAGSGMILGGIVPHHLLACRLMANFFDTLAEDPPETVIVIGPNHKLAGKNEIQISSTDWGTPYGILEANPEIAGILADKFGKSQNDELFENEHSISSLVPYIKYYLPGTKIVPVLLHGSYPLEEATKLGSILGDIVSDNPGTIVIASIDFSHYLNTAQADKMDIITWNAIRTWDLQALSLMGNDNLDTVPAITALMTAMDAVSAKNIDLTGHNNSARITQSGYEYTTSYFTMVFRRDGQADVLP
jgi:AmmeMemoRadiSam system protein B